MNDHLEVYDAQKLATAPLRKGFFQGQEVQYQLVDGMAIMEGDMVLSTDGELPTAPLAPVPEGAAMGVVRTDKPTWPNGIVPFVINANLPNQQRVTDAIKHWEDRSTVSFRRRTTEPNYVEFIASTGAWSDVGMIGGKQQIGLSSGSTTGNAIHEIGHTLGFWHEQSREDRDNWIQVATQNIETGKAHNFDKHVVDGQDVHYYDYDSIMHYPRTAFSKNNEATIATTIPGVNVGQRNGLSTGDMLTGNYLYPGQFFFIVSKLNGFVLDISGANRGNGAQIIAWPKKTSGADNQLWTFTKEGFIVSKLNGFVLDITGIGTNPQTPIISWPKKPGTTANQTWRFDREGFIVTNLNEFVLDIRGNNRAAGAVIQSFPRKAATTENQRWSIEPANSVVA